MSEYSFDGSLTINSKNTSGEDIFNALKEIAVEDYCSEPGVVIKENEVNLVWNEDAGFCDPDFNFFRDLERLAEKCSLSVNGTVEYWGSNDGRVRFVDSKMDNHLWSVLGEQLDRLQDEMVKKYRSSIIAYFKDSTDEGRIDKYARMQTWEQAVNLVAPLVSTRQIYLTEYNKYYRA